MNASKIITRVVPALVLCAVTWLPVIAQSTSYTGTTPLPVTGEEQRDQQAAQQFRQQHPNWATNHPQAAQFYKSHPELADRSLDKYNQRQWGQQHPNWVSSHPNLAKYDYRHPEWATNHPYKALGGGRQNQQGGSGMFRGMHGGQMRLGMRGGHLH